MHKIDEALYFVEEKNNQVELTDNGIKFLSGDTDSGFSSIGTEIAISKNRQRPKLRKDYSRFRCEK
jgi:preprotein translocase subunit SecA